MLRLIYMGTPAVSAKALGQLIESGFNIVAVVSQPDKPSGRGLQFSPTPVKEIALAHQIPVFQPRDMRDSEFLKEIENLKADLSVVFAFRMLPIEVIAKTRLGAINLHTSLLPRYRGAAPVAWAIYFGEMSTGVSIFQLDAMMDHGTLLAQKSIAIDDNENADELLNRLVDIGIPLLKETLSQIEDNTIQTVEQNHELACPARKLKKEDSAIDWKKSARDIHNQIRAFNPFPICTCALTTSPDKLLRIHRSMYRPDINATRGMLMRTPLGEAIVGCGEGSIQLLEVQWPGKAKTDGKSFLNGLQGKGPWQLL